jgi:ferric-dicitrate binding protein FerR (iron transport regulator)
MSSPEDMDNPVDMDTVLRRGLRTEPLSSQALQRIRSATEAQWRASNAAPSQPRHWWRYASAAVVVLVLAGGWLLLSRQFTGAPGPVLGRLERADYPGVVERHAWSTDRPLDNGALLRSGQNILARGGARIALPVGGSIRVAPGTGIEVLSDQLLKVVDGSVYVDIPPASSSQVRFAVQTPAGTFTHLGTQFQVAVQGGQTRVRVREGQVRWHSAAGDVVSAAGSQLLIDQQGVARSDQMTVTGASWSWAEALAAAYDIENQSLAAFLRYIGRETGRKVVYSDPQVEHRAASTILHGSIQEFTAVEALSAVMATTSLRFTLEGDSIRIESGSDPEKKTR